MKKSAPSTPRSHRPVILIVEDDRSLREGLAMNLRMEGFDALTAADGDTGLRMAFESTVELIVLDIMLPGCSGLDILDELRKRRNDVPVLILSARGRMLDKIAGLNLGADDYMTKPFDLPELLARLKAMLRRRETEREAAPPLALGPLMLDRAARSVTVGGQAIALSAREFDLLCLLAEAPGRVFTRQAILDCIWGWDYEGTPRTVDNYVASLRKKLGAITDHPTIRTLPRVGYRLDP